MNNRETLIWLNSLKCVGCITASKIEKYFGEIRFIWTASAKEIQNMSFINEKIKGLIIKNRNIEYYNRHIEKLKKLDIEVITIYDKKYPDSLKNIYAPPKVLYIKGEFLKENEKSIAIVGARKATAYGRWASEKFATELTQIGISVISGMAKGIDTKAHWGAINNNGRTHGILGCGVDVIYPKSNRELYNKIYNNGSIVSEFPPGTQPLSQNFPQRNRIISGLSLGVIVIEAGEKSGSLITAHHGLDQGKDVFALPGNINSIYSRGTNLLIKDGARVLMDINDILDEIVELKEIKNNNIEKNIKYEDLSEEESIIIKKIVEKPAHCDMIAYECGLNISKVNSILTILEMKGYIKQLPGKIFTVC
ncbi:DNA-processing protein DprA [Sporosalibacterium faouarense]|uniref:DNA-processing protein DprA n=1 Tax=Sporosalibacterium faouarense TaxID=516123 RepID=UPI00192CB294|nr:DNA-processing protein DprA [Sporosalibacterium faouarense]